MKIGRKLQVESVAYLAIAILATIASTISVSARSLTPEEALARAMNTSGPHKTVGKGKVYEYVRAVSSKNDSPAVYLYQSPSKGYLVLSAEESAVPMLGYSPEGDLTEGEMPEQMQHWLSQMADEIEYATTNGIPMSAPASVGAPIEPLIKSKWGQDYPYNLYTPEIYGDKAPTGCVATAMAQIMYYHQWPAGPTGMGFASDENGNEYSMPFDGISFEWDKMTDTYDENSSIESQEAVSKLMQCAGYSVNTYYGYLMSGSNDERALNGLINNMIFSKNAKIIKRGGFYSEEWDEILYTQLKQHLPIIYGGHPGIIGGHSFVCDGYDGNGYYHFNWGWNGFYDGYFLTSCLVPEGVGTGGYAEGYNYYQDILCGLFPDNGIQYESYDFVRGEIAQVIGTEIHLLLRFTSKSENIGLYECGVCITSSETAQTPEIITLGTCNGGDDNDFELKQDQIGILDENSCYSLRLVWRPLGETKWRNAISTPGSLRNDFYIGSVGGYISYRDGSWTFTTSQYVMDPDRFKINSILFNDNRDILKNCVNYIDVEATNLINEYTHVTLSVCFIDENNRKYYPMPVDLDLSPNESGVKKLKANFYGNIPVGKYQVEILNSGGMFTGDDHGYTLWKDDTRYFNVVEGVAVESIDMVGNSQLTGIIGDQIQLYAKVNPENATYKDIIWTSDNEDIATVDSNGLVTLKGTGRATIRISPVYSNVYMSKGWWIDVEAPTVPATSISLDKSDIILHKGDTVTLNATIEPFDATKTNVTWHTSNASVAIVDNGKITAKAGGKCNITVMTSNRLTATCHVKVIVEPTSISLNSNEIELTKGETYGIDAILSPDDVTEDSVQWSSSDIDVATVDRGIVTAISAGDCEITATTLNGLTATCVVKVLPITVASIDINPDVVEAVEGSRIQLEYVVYPENADNKQLEWTSSDVSVAAVTSDGEITIKGIGFATITAMTTDGSGVFATCNITGVSTVDRLFAEGRDWHIYTDQGALLHKNAGREDMEMLRQGIYIITDGVTVFKIIK